MDGWIQWYWWEPDTFFSQLAEKDIPFTKIKFPTFNSQNNALMDGTPDGLGSCDFVLANMEVVIRKEMKEFAPEAYSLLSRLKLTKTDIEYVMNQHLKLSSTTMAKQSESDPDLVVHAAAEMWVKNHPSVWKSWISGCIDPEATNYNKNVDPEQGNGDKCLCKNGLPVASSIECH